MEILEIISHNQESNTYIIKNNNKSIIIDCGASVEELEKRETTPSAVLLTHGHFDHILNLKEYVEKFNCEIYASEKIIEKLLDSNKNLSSSFYIKSFNFTNTLTSSIHLLKDETINICGIEIHCITLPGHSECGMGYIISNHLFSGDTIFSHCVGRYDLYDSSFLKLRKSLEKIKALKITHIHPGHGSSFNK